MYGWNTCSEETGQRSGIDNECLLAYSQLSHCVWNWFPLGILVLLLHSTPISIMEGPVQLIKKVQSLDLRSNRKLSESSLAWSRSTSLAFCSYVKHNAMQRFVWIMKPLSGCTFWLPAFRAECFFQTLCCAVDVSMTLLVRMQCRHSKQKYGPSTSYRPVWVWGQLWRLGCPCSSSQMSVLRCQSLVPILPPIKIFTILCMPPWDAHPPQAFSRLPTTWIPPQ